MTASLSRLPLMAGGALMSALGQAGLWGIARFARAPLASTGVLVMTTLSVMAASNALYFQKRHHPAPLFAPALEQRVASVDQQQAQPVPPAAASDQPAVIEPVLRTGAPAQPLPDFNSLPQQQASQPISPQTTASTGRNAADSDGPVGNADVYAVQKKLAELKLLSGKIDGYYGPSTANAIRAFELSLGLTPQGALTPDIMKAILRAPVLNPASAPAREQIPSQQLARVAPAPTVTPSPGTVQAPPAAIEQAPVQVASNDQNQLIGRVSDSGPELMLDTVGSSAAQSLDNLVNALGGENNAQPLQRQAGSASQTGARPAAMPPAAVASTAPRANATGTPTTDQKVVSKVQRGLMSLGFLAGAVDGVPGESTARAIRNFEVYYNYKVTGQVTNELVGMLEQAGAVM